MAVSHQATVHYELDQIYLQNSPGADGLDRWIFPTVAMGSGFNGGGVAKDFTLMLPGAVSTGDLTLRMYSPYDMEHATRVSLNGAPLGTVDLERDRLDRGEFADLPLLEGANTVVPVSARGALIRLVGLVRSGL